MLLFYIAISIVVSILVGIHFARTTNDPADIALFGLLCGVFWPFALIIFVYVALCRRWANVSS